MGIIKRIIRIFNGEEWDEYYPKTCGDQIVHIKENGEEVTVPYIIEEGTDGIWHYEKWSNGVAKCRGKYTQKVDITNSDSFAGGRVYFSTVNIKTDFPRGLFIEAPECFSSYQGAYNSAGTGYSAFPYCGDGRATKEKTNSFGIMRIGSYVYGVTAYVDYYAIGRWK